MAFLTNQFILRPRRSIAIVYHVAVILLILATVVLAVLSTDDSLGIPDAVVFALGAVFLAVLLVELIMLMWAYMTLRPRDVRKTAYWRQPVPWIYVVLIALTLFALLATYPGIGNNGAAALALVILGLIRLFRFFRLQPVRDTAYLWGSLVLIHAGDLLLG